MAYNPSIHTASNKPYGVTNKPDGARYWYYDTGSFAYRPYVNVAEVLSYLIANDRKGATVQIGQVEYWWPNSSDLSDAGLVAKNTFPVVTQTIAAAQPDVYTLSVGELAAINTYSRYPNFVATIGGTPFPDIQPTYNGTLGALTSVTVQLHSDGGGLNVDDTIVQFS